jgi:hypothetical protein
MRRETTMLDELTDSKARAHAPARPSHKLDVSVLATLNEEEGVDFFCTWQIDSGPTNSGPILLAHDSGEYDVEFDLDDRTGLDLKFLPTVDESIWINSACCPFQASGNDEKGQISDKARASKTKLKLKNANLGDPCVLHYRLRFDGHPWTSPNGNNFVPPYSKDPDFRNGGGN